MKKLLLILAALPAFGQTAPVPPCQQIPCYVATTGNVAVQALAKVGTVNAERRLEMQRAAE